MYFKEIKSQENNNPNIKLCCLVTLWKQYNLTAIYSKTKTFLTIELKQFKTSMKEGSNSYFAFILMKKLHILDSSTMHYIRMCDKEKWK